MGFLDTVEDYLRSFNDEVRDIMAVGQDPRDLGEADLQNFDESADRRIKPKTQVEIHQRLVAHNPMRWGRMQRDLKYFKKVMRKHGLNPEDLRFML